MIKALRLNHQEFAEFYGELCDAIYRHDHPMLDDSFHHTSKESRELALKLADRLANCGYLEYK